MESCINFGQSACMFGEITVKNNSIEQNNFDMYRVVRINESPKKMEFTSSSQRPTSRLEVWASRALR